MSLLAAQMVHNVDDMVLSDFLTGHSSQTYENYIQITKSLPHRPNDINEDEDAAGEESETRMIGTSRLDDVTFFSSWTDDGLLLVWSHARTSKTLQSINCSTLLFSARV